MNPESRLAQITDLNDQQYREAHEKYQEALGFRRRVESQKAIMTSTEYNGLIRIADSAVSTAKEIIFELERRSVNLSDARAQIQKYRNERIGERE